MTRTWLIVRGLLVALAPLLLAAFGAAMAGAYGRSLLGELLQWSLLLLIVSIPIGAVMIVAAFTSQNDDA